MSKEQKQCTGMFNFLLEFVWNNWSSIVLDEWAKIRVADTFWGLK